MGPSMRPINAPTPPLFRRLVGEFIACPRESACCQFLPYVPTPCHAMDAAYHQRASHPPTCLPPRHLPLPRPHLPSVSILHCLHERELGKAMLKKPAYFSASPAGHLFSKLLPAARVKQIGALIRCGISLHVVLARPWVHVVSSSADQVPAAGLQQEGDAGELRSGGEMMRANTVQLIKMCESASQKITGE